MQGTRWLLLLCFVLMMLTACADGNVVTTTEPAVVQQPQSRLSRTEAIGTVQSWVSNRDALNRPFISGITCMSALNFKKGTWDARFLPDGSRWEVVYSWQVPEQTEYLPPQVNVAKITLAHIERFSWSYFENTGAIVAQQDRCV